MQPIKDGYSPVISPTVAAESRTYHCLSSKSVRYHIKDIQLNHPASYNTKSGQFWQKTEKNRHVPGAALSCPQEKKQSDIKNIRAEHHIRFCEKCAVFRKILEKNA